MTPFLKSIAKAYVSRYRDLQEICFVFPNKRSGTFFLKYLKEEYEDKKLNRKAAYVSPEVMTITDLVGVLSGRVVASRLDQLFILYEAYREVRKLPVDGEWREFGEDFDSFRTWGETVLADFSEVDQYMVNYKDIFKNVKDYREITANFLTEEQKKIMEEYFGRPSEDESEKFWKDFSDDADLSDLKKRFVRLWQILTPLYEIFSKKLEEQGLTTPGGSYKLAVEALRKNGRTSLPYKKIVFVGFNALSSAEAGIFAEIRDMEGFEGMDAFGDFFWDATGPVLSEDVSSAVSNINSASKFVRVNIRRFPAPEWALPMLHRSDSKTMPRIIVVSAPSKAAQTKIAGSLLKEQRGRIPASEVNEAKVAVVLPDEGLLLPMLYSLPEGMGNVNLTMGYSLRLTSVVSFVALLRKLEGRKRFAEGEIAFYHKDVRLLLGHPFSHALFGGEAVGKIIKMLDKHHKAVITLTEIKGFSEEAGALLDTSKIDTPVATIAFIDTILARVKEAIESMAAQQINSILETDHITVYRNALRRLGDLLNEYGVGMHPSTVFRLVDRLLAGEKVGFEGEPLTGLQVMGTLETRSVDFDYITILSMNERLMPRRARSRSFIPDSLRRAYGMPPSNYAESIFAYYFFRMISRAKEVTLVYDARTGGGTGGSGVSRYILQLEHLYAKGMIEKQNWNFRLTAKEDTDASVEKTPEILELINEFGKEGGRNFSASSLSAYRECEVKFFYKSVLGINTDPEATEYIDAIMVGNILHEVMLNIYVPEKYQKKFLLNPLLIEGKWLEDVISKPEFVRMLITRAVNRLHFRLPAGDLSRPLKGGAMMVARQIFEQVMRVLRHDLRLTPFKILGCEIDETLRISLPSGRVVNFRFAIDRLDEITVNGRPQVRIVDYKTGSLEQDAPDEETLFNGDYKSKQLFQLFTYAWLLGKSSGGFADEDVRVEIYHVPDMAKGKSSLPKIGKAEVTSYSQYASFFSDGMYKMLENVFTKADFEATDDEKRCAGCELRALCRR